MRFRWPTVGVAGLLWIIAGCSQGRSAAPAPPAREPSPPPPAAEQMAARTSAPAIAPTQQGDPAPPVIERVWLQPFIMLPDGSGGYGLDDVTVTGTTAKVPVQPFALNVQLKPWPGAEWFSRVQVEGGGTVQVDGTEHGLLRVTFPEGPAGTRLTVTLPGADGKERVTYRLERVELPRASLAVQVDGAWVPVSPEQVYPAVSPQIRITFDRPMARATVEQALQRFAWPHGGAAAPEGLTVAWQDDQTVTVSIKKAPPIFAWSLGGARAQDGLPLNSPMPALHFGEPAYLVAIDPTTGQEERLTNLPAELRGGGVIAGGQKLLLEGIRHEYIGAIAPRWIRWLIHLDGRTETLPFAGDKFLYVDAAGRLQAFQRGERLAHGLSPDGTRVASLYAEGFGRTDPPPGYLYPHDLVIQSTDGQVLQVVRRVMNLYAPPKDYPLRATLVWSPDGKRIATLSDEPDGGAIAVVDLTTGEVRRVATLPPDMGHGTPYSFFWNGDRFLVGPVLFDASGRVERKLPGYGPFSPDGRWILLHRAADHDADPAWGEVEIASLQTGEVRMLGEGMVLGWRADGKALVARWADWRSRFVANGL